MYLDTEQLLQCRARPLERSHSVGARCNSLQSLRHAQQIGCNFAVLTPQSRFPDDQCADEVCWQHFEGMREQVSLPMYVDAMNDPSMTSIIELRMHGAQGMLTPYVWKTDEQ